MAPLGPGYLIVGDDHEAVNARRMSLLARVNAEPSLEALETLSGAKSTPAALAELLGAPSLGMGLRVIVAESVERWKEDQVAEHLEALLAAPAPATTVALFACEDAKSKAPPALHRLVRDAGGQVLREASVKPWELPQWIVREAGALGLSLDDDGARTLLGLVGERRERLRRELEKLALERGASRDSPVPLSAEDVALGAARSAEANIFALADLLVSGAPADTIGAYLRLHGQGERFSSMQYRLVARLRQALTLAEGLEHGERPDALLRSLRMPRKAAQRLLKDAGEVGTESLRRALTILADAECQTRGGPVLRADRRGRGASEEDTIALRALAAIGAGRSR